MKSLNANNGVCGFYFTRIIILFNNDLDYFSIDSIISEPDYKIENFSLTSLNEVSLKRFLTKKKTDIK